AGGGVAGGNPGLRQAADGRLQVSPQDRLRGRPAEDGLGQGQTQGVARAGKDLAAVLARRSDPRRACTAAQCRTTQNPRAVRYDGPVRDDNDAVADHVIAPLFILDMPAVDDLHVMADATVLVQDGPLDHAVVADVEIAKTPAAVGGAFLRRLKAVGADQDRVAQRDVAAEVAADADDAPLQAGAGPYHATVTDQAVLQVGRTDARSRQVTHARVDDAVRGVEVERRRVTHQGEVGLEVGFDRSQVFPVVIKQVGLETVA